MLPASCDFDYIYEPLSPYRSSIFAWINHFMPDDANILDLGCGAVGFYWALHYLEKANHIAFADRNPDVIDLLASRIDSLTPRAIRDQFGDMTDDAQAWLEEFHDKTGDLQIVDALTAAPAQKYNAVLALELFDCANDEDQLSRMIAYCANSLEDGGRLIGCALNFTDWTESLESLSQSSLAGKLNPSAGLLQKTLEKSGLNLAAFETRDPGMKNYAKAHFFCAERKA